MPKQEDKKARLRFLGKVCSIHREESPVSITVRHSFQKRTLHKGLSYYKASRGIFIYIAITVHWTVPNHQLIHVHKHELFGNRCI